MGFIGLLVEPKRMIETAFLRGDSMECVAARFRLSELHIGGLGFGASGVRIALRRVQQRHGVHGV